MSGRRAFRSAWERAKQPNELMIFDESGESPTKARLVYG